MSHVHTVEKAIRGNEEAFEELIINRFLYISGIKKMQDKCVKPLIESLRQPEYFRTCLTKILIRTA